MVDIHKQSHKQDHGEPLNKMMKTNTNKKKQIATINKPMKLTMTVEIISHKGNSGMSMQVSEWVCSHVPVCVRARCIQGFT